MGLQTHASFTWVHEIPGVMWQMEHQLAVNAVIILGLQLLHAVVQLVDNLSCPRTVIGVHHGQVIGQMSRMVETSTYHTTGCQQL